MKNAILIIMGLALSANALTVEEAKANLDAARAAYRAARAEAGITNTPRRVRRPAVSSAKPVFTDSQQSFFENRRICVSRDVTTIPGSVITTWHRNGKPDTQAPAVVTNVLKKVVGAEQMNPIQKLAELWHEAATNAMVRIERANAALDEKRAEYVQKRDAAALPTTKAIYQAFIDAIDRIKEKIDTQGA